MWPRWAKGAYLDRYGSSLRSIKNDKVVFDRQVLHKVIGLPVTWFIVDRAFGMITVHNESSYRVNYEEAVCVSTRIGSSTVLTWDFRTER
jgi:hypothetical protein